MAFQGGVKGIIWPCREEGRESWGEVFYHWHCLELLVHVILESRTTFSPLNSFTLSTDYAPLLPTRSGHLRRHHVSTSLTWLYIWLQGDIFSACWRSGVWGGEQLTNEPWTITATWICFFYLDAVIASFNWYSPSRSKTKFICHPLCKSLPDTQRQTSSQPQLWSQDTYFSYHCYEVTVAYFTSFLSMRQGVLKGKACVSFTFGSLCCEQMPAQSRRSILTCVGFANTSLVLITCQPRARPCGYKAMQATRWERHSVTYLCPHSENFLLGRDGKSPFHL